MRWPITIVNKNLLLGAAFFVLVIVARLPAQENLEPANSQTAQRKSVAPFSVQRVGHDSSSANGSYEPIPIAPPSKSSRSDAPASPKPTTPMGALATVIGSLAIVLGLFLLVVWFTRRALPNASTSLPAEVIETLGRAPLGTRQNMHLVRVGNKLLLLCVSANGADTLTEITDREEVDRIAGICQQNRPNSISTSFRQVLSQFANDPAAVESGSSNQNQPIARTPRRTRTIENVEV